MEDSIRGTGTITSEFTVWCCKCVAWEQVSAYNKTSAIKKFKVVGWKKSKDGWVCPKHATK